MYITHSSRTGALQVHKVNHFKQRGVLSKTIYCTTVCTILAQFVNIHFISET